MFKCCKDNDIETFLHTKAIEFIEEGTCAVYLVLNEDAFDSGEIQAEAYFALSHRALIFEPTVSKARRKKITNFKDRESAEFVLIGQLGKHISEEYVSPITLPEILDYIFEIIHAASELIPCHFALVECLENLHEKGIYEANGFTLLQKSGEFYQYYIPID